MCVTVALCVCVSFHTCDTVQAPCPRGQEGTPGGYRQRVGALRFTWLWWITGETRGGTWEPGHRECGNGLSHLWRKMSPAVCLTMQMSQPSCHRDLGRDIPTGWEALNVTLVAQESTERGQVSQGMWRAKAAQASGGHWQVMRHRDSCHHPPGDSGDTGTAATTDGAPVSSRAAEKAPLLGTGGTQEVPALALSPPLPSQPNRQSSHSWIVVGTFFFFSFQYFLFQKSTPKKQNISLGRLGFSLPPQQLTQRGGNMV